MTFKCEEKRLLRVINPSIHSQDNQSAKLSSETVLKTASRILQSIMIMTDMEIELATYSRYFVVLSVCSHWFWFCTNLYSFILMDENACSRKSCDWTLNMKFI